MASYRLTPDAQSDLVDIRRYTLKLWGKVQSKKYMYDLRQTIRLLAETPFLGKSRLDVDEAVLSFPHVSHVIYYMVHERQLVVFGVLHKRMVPVNHLDGREVI